MAAGSPFHHHLTALTSEYERIMGENKELRQRLANAPPAQEPISHLRHLGHGEESAKPIVMTTTTTLKTPCLDLPGLIVTTEVDSSPLGPGGPPPQLDQSPRRSLKTFTPKSSKSSAVTNMNPKRDRVVDEIDGSEENATFLLMLDIIPAFVIMVNAGVVGLSADMWPESPVWQALEVCFTIFFIAEIAVKMRVFGRKEYLFGGDWYWSWFDILCVVLALVDMTITFSASPETDAAVEEEKTSGNDTAVLGILKMLKLARLGRIVRLLKFKIFTELKLMIQGVFTGLRVLFWAVVLLLSCMYLLGVMTKTLYWEQHAEFATVPIAMFTVFRCFTDGCAGIDGTPLQERMRAQHGPGGGIFMFVYILLFLFVTIGIFNLIMAVFIDNVADGSTKKRQRELGENAPKTEWVISTALRHLILTNIFHNETKDLSEEERTRLLNEKVEKLKEMYGFRPHSTQEYEELSDEIRAEMLEKSVVVTREQFNRWLSTEKDLISKLDDAEIDLSCKSDLFEVLDADLSGELEFDEMVDGLLKCRGPVSKTDIISIRLKTALLVKLVTQICDKLGIEAGD